MKVSELDRAINPDRGPECPRCDTGILRYASMGSHSVYVCDRCNWLASDINGRFIRERKSNAKE